LNTNTLEWEAINATGTGGSIPGPRAFHSFEYWNNHQTIVLFGGLIYNVFVTEFNAFGDMWLYHPETKFWEAITYASSVNPGPRIGIHAPIVGHVMYMFGGYNQFFQPQNDIWKFDLNTKIWTELIPGGDSPSLPGPRFIYNCQLDSANNRIYYFGGNLRDGGAGVSTVQYNDTWFYDIQHNSWNQVLSDDQTDSKGRTHAASAFFNNHFIIALGDAPGVGSFTVAEASSGQNPTNTVLALDTQHPERNYVTVPFDFKPIPLKRVSYETVGSKLYLNGGFGFQGPTNTSLTPVWNPYVFILPLGEASDDN